MRKTHFKDTIGKVGLCFGLLLLGEGLFGFGLFWPVLLALIVATRQTYYWGFLLGLLLSVMSATPLGLASLIITGGLFIFERCRYFWRDNVWLTGLAAVMFGLAGDKILGLSWSLFEGFLVLGLTYVIWRFDYFSDEVALSR